MFADLITLGPFAFDPATGRLTRDGTAVPLGGRALAVLTALAAAEGTVTKEALLAAAWPGVIVEEGNLTVQVAALRKLLGDDVIVTVPRVGYRLRRGGTPTASGLPRLAVLPFEIIGGGAEDGYFADGLAEDMIGALGRFRQFAVLSRRSALAVRDDLGAAGVRYRLDGSLRRSGARLRIAAQLSEVADGRQLWAHSFDGTPEDVFAFQDRITEAVAAAVAPGIEAAEIAAARTRGGSMAAYDLYLRALPELNSQTVAGNRRAEALLARALELEPDNGLFLAYAARVLEHRATMSWSTLGPEDRSRALAFARRALTAADGDPRALVRAGLTLFMMGKEYELGMAATERALAANPHNTMVMVEAGIPRLYNGDLGDARALFERVLDLAPGDPLVHIAFCALAHIALIQGDWDDAIVMSSRAQAVNPNFEPSLWIDIAAHAHSGQMAEASLRLRRLLDLTPGSTLARIRAAQPDRPERTGAMIEGLRLAGLPEA